MLQKPASAVAYEKELGLDDPGIRHFKNIDEVRENLDTITFEECHYCNVKLGLSFSFADGKVVDVYSSEESPVYDDRQVS